MTGGTSLRLLAFGVIALLAGCNSDSPSGSAPPSAGTMAARAAERATGQQIAYTHGLTLVMPAADVQVRYDAARTRCLADPSHCTLISASLTTGDGGGGADGDGAPEGRLTLRLAHGAVEPAEAALRARLPGEAPGDPVVRTRSTEAQDLTRPIADTETRLHELTDYRARLEALTQRPDVKTDDLIRIASEIARVQSQIEGATGDRTTLATRVQTEILSVVLVGRSALTGRFAPVVRVWDDSATILAQSTADALRFALEALPWLPVTLILLWVFVRIWRIAGLRWRRRRAATPLQTTASTAPTVQPPPP